jgi:hypothetical protein
VNSLLAVPVALRHDEALDKAVMDTVAHFPAIDRIVAGSHLIGCAMACFAQHFVSVVWFWQNFLALFGQSRDGVVEPLAAEMLEGLTFAAGRSFVASEPV